MKFFSRRMVLLYYSLDCLSIVDGCYAEEGSVAANRRLAVPTLKGCQDQVGIHPRFTQSLCADQDDRVQSRDRMSRLVLRLLVVGLNNNRA